MPNHKSAVKRVRQSKRRKAYNQYYKVMVKRAIKDVRAATTPEDAEQKFRRASQLLDRISTRGIIKKNYASNNKAKLARYVNSLKAEATE